MDLINGQSFKWIPDTESGRYHRIQLTKAGSTTSLRTFVGYLLGLTLFRCFNFKLSFKIIFVFIFSGVFYLRAQPLPENWWQNMSAEEVLTKAKSITESCPYLKLGKSKMINAPANGFELYQRHVQGDALETKEVRFRKGQVSSVTYSTTSGSYFFMEENGVPIKHDFESDLEIEARVAKSLVKPYEYEFLKPDMSGTNNCLVISVQMVEGMVAAIAKEFRIAMPLFNPEYIRTKKIFYVRKSDGIMLGYIARIASGQILDDRLADLVNVSTPIPNEDFLIPNLNKAVRVKSLDASGEITTSNIYKTSMGKGENQKKSRSIARFILITALIVPAALMIGLAYKKNFNAVLTNKKLLGGVEERKNKK